MIQIVRGSSIFVQLTILFFEMTPSSQNNNSLQFYSILQEKYAKKKYVMIPSSQALPWHKKQNHQKLLTWFQGSRLGRSSITQKTRLKSDNYYVLPIKKCALQGFMSPVITMRKLGKYLTVPGPSEPQLQFLVDTYVM